VRRLPDRSLAAPCRVLAGAGGTGLEPIAIKGSHDFVSLAGAQALALIESGEGEADAGDEVEMVLLVAG
jgi:molybdopterin biosynthesis enzyme